jgi:hypothetical protein
LWEIEEHLTLLFEAWEDLEFPDAELRAELLADIGEAMERSAEKRDAMAHYRAHLQSQIELADSEMERLEKRKRGTQGALKRLDAYLLSTMERLEVKKLEGRTATIAMRRNPAGVDILELEAVPERFKDVEVKMPLASWSAMVDELPLSVAEDFARAVRGCEITPRLTEVKNALTRGEVPGAQMRRDVWRVEVR